MTTCKPIGNYCGIPVYIATDGKTPFIINKHEECIEFFGIIDLELLDITASDFQIGKIREGEPVTFHESLRSDINLSLINKVQDKKELMQILQNLLITSYQQSIDNG